MTPMLWAFEQREILIEFYERVSGARLHAAYFRAGSVHQDMPAGITDDILAYAEAFPTVIDEIEVLLTTHRIFQQRTVDLCFVSEQEAIAWGFTDPLLLRSGGPLDLCKAKPYTI